jgi:hypothetical protein
MAVPSWWASSWVTGGRCFHIFVEERFSASNRTAMKFLFSILLFATSVLGQSASAPSPSQSVPPDQENPRKAKRIIDEMIQTLGGQVYLNIQDITQEGRSYSLYHGQPRGGGVIFWHYYKYPDKDRTEFTKKRDVIYVNNGDKGYEITFRGTHAQDPKELADFLRRRHYALDVVLRKWLVEPGVALFYEGESVAESKAVEQITVRNSHNEAVTLFIDANTHLPVKKTFTWRDPTDKQRNTEDEIYDNYREAQGIVTPFTVTRFFNGEMTSQRFLTSVSYNQGLADSKFQPDLGSPPK